MEQVCIKSFPTELEADLAKKILEENSIKSVLQQGGITNGYIQSPWIVGISMFVLKKDAEKAKDLLNQMENK